eukprot:TRINITY_DN15889_c0_g1_i2.p1 TRINITY_DN15889_c0_g1~~TRINITY_DN15889_c0_g1_i2.p1  ORF type:complete len:667 (+),score=139.37 TRINITY_DN15889_c0_g1_i2:60-2003(+)
MISKAQRRSFYYWFNFADKRSKEILTKRTTGLSKYAASYPNAQELPDTHFSYFQRMRDVRMLAAKKHEVAQSALLQFNVMVRQKVRPNVMTYTSLIQLMADAEMELTAFKLFNRMLQQEIAPIPETYMALLQATSPMRQGLIDEIQRKMYSCVESGPREMMKRRRELAKEELIAANQYVKDLSTEDPEDIAELNLQKELQKLHTLANYEELDPESSNATVYVDSLKKAFFGNEWETAGRNTLTQAQRDSLRPQIEKLSDLELGMFLTIHRQERPESREQKIQNILLNIQEGFIFEMLQQRQAYVNTMKEILQRNAKMSEMITTDITSPQPGPTEVRSFDGSPKGKKKQFPTKLVLKKNKKKKSKKGTKKDKNPHLQSGIELRGIYDINYVKLAKRGQLTTLNLKQLKTFFEGEELELLYGKARGTIAEYASIIEKYLFGKTSETTHKGVTPETAGKDYKSGDVSISISDKSDEYGNERSSDKEQDATLQKLVKVMPYTFKSKIVHHVPSPTGGNSRIRLSRIGNTHRFDAYVRRDKPRLTRREQSWIRLYNAAKKKEVTEDMDLYHQVVNDPESNDGSTMWQDYLNHKFDTGFSQRSVREAIKRQHYKSRAAPDLSRLGPLKLHLEKEVERKRLQALSKSNRLGNNN